MRAFLTGGAGFVGEWLRRHLEDCGDEVFLLEDGIDIGDREAIVESLEEAEPEVIYHLAALTHVGRSWDAPEETLRVNVIGTLEVLEAARQLVEAPRVILVSSAEVYGGGKGQPIDESAPVRPVTPYAASKVAAEFYGVQAYLGRGLPVIIARPFNHVGPGQSDDFVVSGLARRVAEVEQKGGGDIRVGNLEAARDFTDVRDVVRAYRLLAEQGNPGEVYNVCSSRPVVISRILEILVAMCGVPVRAVADPKLFRPVDLPILVGDGSKLAQLTGWSPSIALDQTLADVLDRWRHQVET